MYSGCWLISLGSAFLLINLLSWVPDQDEDTVRVRYIPDWRSSTGAEGRWRLRFVIITPTWGWVIGSGSLGFWDRRGWIRCEIKGLYSTPPHYQPTHYQHYHHYRHYKKNATTNTTNKHQHQQHFTNTTLIIIYRTERWPGVPVYCWRICGEKDPGGPRTNQCHICWVMGLSPGFYNGHSSPSLTFL